MNNNNLSKTILGVYRYLPRVTYAFDKLVKTRAYNSGYVCSNNTSFNDVMNVATTILDLTERKITLINLKLIIEKTLKNMDSSFARILILKYIEGKRSIDIAERLKIGKRTYFRKLKMALVSFNRVMTGFGFNSKKLMVMLKNENWIMEVYNSYCKEENTEKDNILDCLEFQKKFEKSIMFEFKNVGVI